MLEPINIYLSKIWLLSKNIKILLNGKRRSHCVKNVRIRIYSGPYSVRMQENTDRNKSEYGHFSRSVSY